jgi:hypothetical protein
MLAWPRRAGQSCRNWNGVFGMDEMVTFSDSIGKASAGDKFSFLTGKGEKERKLIKILLPFLWQITENLNVNSFYSEHSLCGVLFFKFTATSKSLCLLSLIAQEFSCQFHNLQQQCEKQGY